MKMPADPTSGESPLPEDNREDAGSLNPGNSVTLLFTLFIYQSLLFSAAAAAAKSLHSCPTLCDPIDGSPPCSSVPGILQARPLERVAIAFSEHMSLHIN